MNRILIMGPPGAGKGTQATTLAGSFDVPVISTGNLFRAHVAEQTPLGQAAQRYLDAGEYVPDTVTNQMVRDRLADPDCAAGFLLDGYPRTLEQVKVLDEILDQAGVALDGVIALEVDGEEIVGRLLKRAQIEMRSDDTEEVIRRRLDVYAAETAPLLAEYDARGLLVRVDGTGSVHKVQARLFEALEIRV